MGSLGSAQAVDMKLIIFIWMQRLLSQAKDAMEKGMESSLCLSVYRTQPMIS